MSSQSIKTLGLIKRLSEVERGFGLRLPEAYKKFYKEWKLTEPAAVNYIPEQEKWKRDEVTGQIFTIQNHPIPVRYPAEYHDQIWGGDGVIQGFEKRHKYNRRVPHFWVPSLKRSAVYSEVLNKHISVIITERAVQLIHENYGFDHYVLKTLACDLKSLLALSLKRKILQDLSQGCPAYANNPEKQKRILNRYQTYLEAYTPEEIEWYGYSFEDACSKYTKLVEIQNARVPLKTLYRAELIEKLKAAAEESLQKEGELPETTSWIQKINPFNKKQET